MIYLCRTVQWWLASIIGLQEGLIAHIDNLRSRKVIPSQENRVYKSQIHQISALRGVMSTHRVLSEDKPTDQVLDLAKQFIEQSVRA
jgi:hypothetical protein